MLILLMLFNNWLSWFADTNGSECKVSITPISLSITKLNNEIFFLPDVEQSIWSPQADVNLKISIHMVDRSVIFDTTTLLLIDKSSVPRLIYASVASLWLLLWARFSCRWSATWTTPSDVLPDLEG